MSSMTAREWSMQYDTLKKKIQHIRSTGGDFNTDEIRSVLGTITTLDTQLKTMSESPMKYELVASEIGRRQVLLENLKKLTANGTIAARGSRTSPTNTDASAVMSPLNQNRNSTSNNNTNSMSDKNLAQRQKEIMKLQDDMLLDIEVGVGRLHNKALIIGDEARQHNRLLDDLDNNVDIATAALQAEAKHAEQIKEKAQVCWMYICIIVEVFIIVLLLALAFAG